MWAAISAKENGQRTDLGYFGGISSSASDINDAGQIVGKFNIAQDKFNPFLWQNGTMTDLGTLGFNGGAMSINNKGQVVGYSGLVFGITHAFLWENGRMRDLGTGQTVNLQNSKLSVAMSITGLQLIIKDKQSVLVTQVSMAASVTV
ncbi:MAG: hypothetical protein JGK20_32930 [Microcoleus sp. PH2017_05_CCC_O_A]|nr:hypothetical protein [Microcoleus sp. PH2017_05_CCC_O_A]